MDRNIRILILEDVPLDAELMEHQFKKEQISFTSVRVETEEEFRRELKDFQPDVILADHSLPHFDGITAMQIAKEKCPKTPFIFVSGMMGEEFAVEMLKEGATDYVLKHNLSKLVHAVLRALTEFQEHAEKEDALLALQENEKKYRTLFELSPDYIVILDKEGTILDLNRAVEMDIGLKREDIIGNSIEMIASQYLDESFQYEDALSKALSGNLITPFEISFDFGGVRRFIDIRYAPLKTDGELFGFQIIARDITKRKNAEMALLESKERLAHVNTYLEAIIDASPFAIIDQTPDGHIKSLWNPAAEKIYGWTKEEVLGKPLLLREEEVSEYKKLMERVLSGESIYGMELEREKKDGTSIDIIMAAAPLSDIKGQITGIMSTSADITEMVYAKKQLKASLAEKEVLLREIHHRVKNNLQIVSSLISLQADYIKEYETRRMFQDSKNRIRAMALIHEKLYQSEDLSQINFGEYLKSLAEQLIKIYGDVDKEIALTMNYDEVLLNLDTAIPLGLIVNELVSNCLKHAFNNRNDGTIKISLYALGDEYDLCVADDGVGFPGDIDFRETESLGLQIVQTLTLQIKGSIEMKSLNGTKFDIFFKEYSK